MAPFGPLYFLEKHPRQPASSASQKTRRSAPQRASESRTGVYAGYLFSLNAARYVAGYGEVQAGGEFLSVMARYAALYFRRGTPHPACTRGCDVSWAECR